MSRLRLVKDDEVIVPLEVITELLRAGQDLRHSAVAGNAPTVAPSRQRWLKAEIALMKAIGLRA
jgi:hypothetical protein